MRGAMIHAPGDIRLETLDDPKIRHPTDAIIRTAVTCVCGSDLWPYRGAEPTGAPHPIRPARHPRQRDLPRDHQHPHGRRR